MYEPAFVLLICLCLWVLLQELGFCLCRNNWVINKTFTDITKLIIVASILFEFLGKWHIWNCHKATPYWEAVKKVWAHVWITRNNVAWISDLQSLFRLCHLQFTHSSLTVHPASTFLFQTLSATDLLTWQLWLTEWHNVWRSSVTELWCSFYSVWGLFLH